MHLENPEELIDTIHIDWEDEQLNRPSMSDLDHILLV